VAELKIDTDDPKLRKRISEIISRTDVHRTTAPAVVDLLIGALESPPEPAEPPPGVYRDRRGEIWERREGEDDYQWRVIGRSECFRWERFIGERDREVSPLAPLWTAGELIPDPDDDAATEALASEIGFPSSITVRRALADALRVLRARVESRVPEVRGGD
jgi:hypothetical protein